jgi:bifunctional DNA-binding transcriptional regulator/antitoxin component of YhaV-PrlF toxin-antitoxin module
MVATVTVSSKGQIVLPAHIRALPDPFGKE